MLALVRNPAAEIHTTVAPALLPRIKVVADRLRTVGDFNRKVHMEHYNRIIPEVARKVLAEVPGRSLAAL